MIFVLYLFVDYNGFTMIMSKYIVSAIIPVHNTAFYLDRCLGSILGQSLSGIEIILVDDSSTDGSSAMCDEYAKSYSQIQVLHLSKNAGLSAARNAGLKIASAPYIGFIDSDDYIEPEMYADLLNAMLSNKADMAYCNFCYEYLDGRIEHPYPNSGQKVLRNVRDVVLDILREKVSSSSCTKLYKKEIFFNNEFPDSVYFEDHAVIYKWIATLKRIVWVDRAYYHYLQREDSICHTMTGIKHYHYFSAEYPRLSFAIEYGFREKEEIEIINLIIKNCLYHFSEFMKASFYQDIQDKQKIIRGMRCNLKKALSLPSKYIYRRYYKRLFKISYMWMPYYYIHYWQYRRKFFKFILK